MSNITLKVNGRSHTVEARVILGVGAGGTSGAAGGVPIRAIDTRLTAIEGSPPSLASP